MAKTWSEKQVETILKDAQKRYGNGWQHMSKDAQENYIYARILNLVLTQAGEQYRPIQEMIQSLVLALSDKKVI